MNTTNYDHALIDINNQIDELFAKRTEIEKRIEQERKASEEKRRAEREKAFQEIEEMVDNYNNKYDNHLVVVDVHELFNWGLVI
jgi:single-stranded DNA-specific DHH superfamily exonuclease